LSEANRRLRSWLLTEAGLRIHGTTRELPLSRFEATERAALLPLPTMAYDPAEWKHCLLHRDGHITFAHAYYSAPFRCVGQRLWVRASLREIRLFSSDFVLIATHSRATQPGQRFTQPDHLPAHLAEALTLNRVTCPVRAAAIGPSTQQVVAACALGLAHGDVNLCTLKRMLEAGLEAAIPIALPTPVAEALIFARPPEELAAAIVGGASWN
jgi:hypothetical protein